MLRRIFGGTTPKRKGKEHSGTSGSTGETHKVLHLSCTNTTAPPRTAVPKVRCDPVPAAFKKRASPERESSTLQLSMSQNYTTTNTTTTITSPLVPALSAQTYASQHSSKAIPVAAHGAKHRHHSRNHSLSHSDSAAHETQAEDEQDIAGAKSCVFLTAAHPDDRDDAEASLTKYATTPYFGSANRSRSAPQPLGTSTTNLWRLPWSQQKVAMCPNCNRPIRPRPANRHPDAPPPSSSHPELHDAAAAPDATCDARHTPEDSLHSQPGDVTSETHTEAGGRDAAGTVTEICCHCGLPVTVPASMEASPTTSSPVYVVQPIDAEQVLSKGVIAVESDSDSDVEVAPGSVGARMRLSLVSPMSVSLLKHGLSSSHAPRALPYERQA